MTNDGSIDELLQLSPFDDAQLKAFRAHRGLLDVTEGLESEKAQDIYEVLEYNAATRTSMTSASGSNEPQRPWRPRKARASMSS
jgi:hypothetical protein